MKQPADERLAAEVRCGSAYNFNDANRMPKRKRRIGT